MRGLKLKDSISKLNSALSVVSDCVSSTEAAVDLNEKRLDELERRHKSLASRCKLQEAKLDDLEARSRRQNIRIIGIKEKDENGRPTEFVTKLFPELQGEEHFDRPVVVDRAHRIAVPAKDGKPRAIIARLHHFQVKELVRRRAYGAVSGTQQGSWSQWMSTRKRLTPRPRPKNSWVERCRTGTETSALAGMWTNLGLLKRHWQCELGVVTFIFISLLLIHEMEPSFEWGEVSSYTLTWAFFLCQRLALNFCLGYGNSTPAVCFPSVVCSCVWFNVRIFSAHLSFHVYCIFLLAMVMLLCSYHSCQGSQVSTVMLH